jgi:hypothetical protein
VVINELVADPLPGQEDWIELYNNDSVPIDISDWSLSDGGNFFFFPAGTVLDPDSYLTLDRGVAGSFTFGLAKDGEVLSLFDDSNVLMDTTSWIMGQADQPDGRGRLPNGTGPFQTLLPTKNGANQ